jgi:glyoxylase-like metal-dependent hydrolase (beta-lactamase superfamily II)
MRTDVQQVADDTYLVHGSHTNWVILKDGDALTLVDTGYPGDRERVLASLTEVGGSPESVAAVLLTHAHNDHLGSAEHLRARYGTPVYLHPAEVPHARREFLQQVSVGAVLRNAWRPGVLPWLVHALRVGGTEQHPVTAPEVFPAEGPLDLPGAPVPVHTPGHTDGHTTRCSICRRPAS